jgi:hypothetical protein
MANKVLPLKEAPETGKQHKMSHAEYSETPGIKTDPNIGRFFMGAQEKQ